MYKSKDQFQKGYSLFQFFKVVVILISPHIYRLQSKHLLDHVLSQCI